VPAGVCLHAQGETITDVILIHDGIVKQVRVEPDGHELILGLRVAGDFLGSTAAMLDRPLQASAITLTDCRIRRMPVREFLDHLSDPEFSLQLHRLHSREIHDNIQRMAQLGCLRSRQRLEQVLRDFAITNGRGPGAHLQLPMRHYEMARWIGVTPEHLSRLLHQMQDEGLIRVDAGAITVPDPAKL
jgi:CRP-like cAMP-binding protein